MLTTLRFFVGTALMAVCSIVASSTAYAGDPINPIDCSKHPTLPECIIHVGDPGHPGDPGTGAGSGGGSGSGTGSDGCWLEAANDPSAPAGGPQPGGWYVRHCPVAGGGETVSSAFWVVGGPDPGVLAQEAVARLRMPAPGIRTNPPAATDVLVYVPVWLWVDPATWSPQSATAAVAGLAVTATATPVQVRWDAGDGSGVTCAGPGTQWQPGMDPRSSSPTCGYTYRRSSAGRPDNAFTVRATVTWSVTWRASTGQTGAVPDMTTTSSVAVHVAESQAVS